MDKPCYPEEHRTSTTVKDLPTDEQPREKLLRYGASALTNSELFAIILRTGSQNYPITDLCRDLMRFSDEKLLNLERKTRSQIMEINGIGPTKAMQIEAVMEIVRRYSREQIGERYAIRSANDVFAYMKHEIGNLPYEEMWALFLNRSNRVIGKLRVSEGGTTSTVFDVKKVLRNALYEHAESVMLCHNHPSGNTRPSSSDDNVTRRCREACETMELTFLDHVIITSDGFYSYKDNSTLLD